MTLDDQRPRRCSVCGGVRFRGDLPDRLDWDGRVVVGAVQCRGCGARFLYSYDVRLAMGLTQGQLFTEER